MILITILLGLAAMVLSVGSVHQQGASCIVLEAPQNKFDTNHWFHSKLTCTEHASIITYCHNLLNTLLTSLHETSVSEFFLSKNSFISEDWLSSTAANGGHFVFLAPSQRFVTHLTKMTMFLLAATFTDGKEVCSYCSCMTDHSLSWL
jgi:hypothetical protein